MSEKFFLPQEMEKDRAIFEKSQKTILRITTHEPKAPLGIYASKMGGNPYFPLDVKYPCNRDGKPLFMIAQINFADIYKFPEVSQKIQTDKYLKYSKAT